MFPLYSALKYLYKYLLKKNWEHLRYQTDIKCWNMCYLSRVFNDLIVLLVNILYLFDKAKKQQQNNTKT